MFRSSIANEHFVAARCAPLLVSFTQMIYSFESAVCRYGYWGNAGDVQKQGRSIAGMKLLSEASLVHLNDEYVPEFRSISEVVCDNNKCQYRIAVL